jgi:hypothetical protein
LAIALEYAGLSLAQHLRHEVIRHDYRADRVANVCRNSYNEKCFAFRELADRYWPYILLGRPSQRCGCKEILDLDSWPP